MCNYFSGIITEDGQVLWLPENPLNHEAIIEANNLKDTQLKNRKFVRFEITPKSTSELLKVKQRSELTHDLFYFRWDEEKTLPEWVEKNCVALIAKAWGAAEESWKIHLLFGDEFLKKLREKGYIHMMWGTSQVGEMRETSQVGEMYGTSKVSVMRETSKVGEINSFASAVKNGTLYLAKDVTVEKSGKVSAEV